MGYYGQSFDKVKQYHLRFQPVKSKYRIDWVGSPLWSESKGVIIQGSSILRNTSYRKIPWNLEVAILVV